MALNPSIILAGQPIDIVGSFARGNELAAQTNQLQDQNALRQVYKTQGAGLLSGNQSSLNALAAVDPGQAMQLQANQLDMSATRQRMDMLTREEQRQLEAAKASMSAAEAAAAAQQIEDAVKMGLAIQDPAQWDAVMAQQAPELVGQFANRQAFAMKYMTMAEALKANAPPEAPKPQSPQAKFEADKAAGLLPPDAVYKGDAPSVTVNNGGGSDKQVFDAMIVDRDAARAAVSGYNAIVEAKNAVDSGIISGFGADNILAMQKLGAALGVVDPTAIQNTETFRSAIAPQVAAMLRSVAGTANLSNADREFAEKAAGGSIALDDGTIKRLLGIMEKASRTSIEGYQRRLDAVYPNDPAYQRERAILGITPPQFITTEGAGSGSPEIPPAPAGSTPSQSQGAALPPDLQSIYDKYSTP